MHKFKNTSRYFFVSLGLAFPTLVFAESEHPLVDMLAKVLNWLLGIIGVLGLIGFAVSGIMYLTAAGSEDQIERAKKSFTYSILGVLVALAGVILVKTIQARLAAQ